jgi:hypothetical protein
MLPEIEEIAELLNRDVDEVAIEYETFKEKVFNDFQGRLTGEKLDKKAITLFRQNNRRAFIALKKSNAILVNIFVTGVSSVRDDSSFKRNEGIKKYKINPNLAVFNGDVDEYLTKDGKIIKRSLNTVLGEVNQEEVKQLSNNAEKYTDNVYIVPRDSKKKYGTKLNPNYGNEIPLHSFRRTVHGVAEIKGDYRKFTLTLRNKNTLFKNIPIPGKTYTARVLNQTKDGSEEYTFMDDLNVTKFTPIDWNPYGEQYFIEGILSEQIMTSYVKELGDLIDIAIVESDEKERNKERNAEGRGSIWEYTKFNSCLFVEADITKLTLYPASENKTSRVILDDESVDYESELAENMIGWLTDAAVEGLDTGENSRAIICCYPKIIKYKDPNKADALSIDVYGVLSTEEGRTKFNREDYEKINNLNDEYDI